MKYFLYRMDSNHIPPGGGDFRSWLHFYKWGRPETVTFRTSSFSAQKGDVVFFVLDGFLIGDALIKDVRQNVFIEGWGPAHEMDVAEGGIWEYLRGWGIWNQYRDRLRLVGLDDEVPAASAVRWMQTYRDVDDLHYPSGRVPVFKPDESPPFFGIKKK